MDEVHAFNQTDNMRCYIFRKMRHIPLQPNIHDSSNFCESIQAPRHIHQDATFIAVTKKCWETQIVFKTHLGRNDGHKIGGLQAAPTTPPKEEAIGSPPDSPAMSLI